MEMEMEICLTQIKLPKPIFNFMINIRAHGPGRWSCVRGLRLFSKAKKLDLKQNQFRKYELKLGYEDTKFISNKRYINAPAIKLVLQHISLLLYALMRPRPHS